MNFEIKDTLARLLATENLIVEHRKVSTASFDVEKRVLTLPMWEKASNRVYDLLVGHEVGHALYTPNLNWKVDDYACVPISFVNVVEDARIEKLMKRRYAGLGKTFYKGYQELHDQDFFSLDGEDINSMSFIDRINLYYKIGAYHVFKFSEEEKPFVHRVGQSETFDEVLDISKDIYLYLKEKEDNAKKEKFDSKDLQQGQGQEQQNKTVDIEPSDEGDGAPGDAPGDASEGDEESFGGHGGGEEFIPDEFESSTDSAFTENQQDLINHSSFETVYLKIPAKIDLDRIVIDCAWIQNMMSEYYVNESVFNHTRWESEHLKHTDAEYVSYKKDAAKGVNYLVKEFEMKKSAAAYSRAAVSKTGSLDTTKLHNYKFSEDIFKKITVLPEGKNHGLVFILDWSGSMSNVMLDTVKQLLNLIWFCRKVNIPFEVYAFTYEFPPQDSDFDEDNHLCEVQELAENEMYLNKSFRLLNLLSHKRSSSDFEKDCRNIWRLAYNVRNHWGSAMIPPGFSLSGTPLNESIVTLHHLLPKFIKETGVDKVNTVFLTDGESNTIGRVVELKNKYSEVLGRYGKISIGTHCQLRDTEIGATYPQFNNYNWYNGTTNILMRNLKDKFPNINFISYRVVEGKDVSNVFNYYTGVYTDINKKQWSKEKSAILNTSGYDVMYAIASSSLNQSSDFTVAEDATKAQIRAAFKKSLKSKAANKKTLSSFATMVA